ncbi:MAG TPA: hypothetical protein VK157_04090 [Phycisphaerales bacterium]|nr:hypothetical protein [Phycisphaerales bacterium]
MVCVRKSVLAASVVAMAAACASGQIAAPFTYQGEFLVDGLRVTGVYDMRFTLHDSPSVVAAVTPAVCANNVQVIDGKFTVEIQWTQNDMYPPTGGFRYLQVFVREDSGLGCNTDVASYTTLSPRTKMTFTPYASSSLRSFSASIASNADELGGEPPSFYQNASNINAGTLSAARLPATVAQTGNAQTFTAVQSFNGGSASVAPFNVNSTAKVSSLNADLLDGLDSAAFAGVSHTHDASAIVSGVLADARLASNVVRRDAANQFLQVQTFGANLVVVNPTSPLVGIQAGYATDQAFIKIGGLGNGSANGLVFQNFTNATLMKLQDNGDVGIGTATPAARLHVRGTGALGEVIVTPGVIDSTSQLSLFENQTATLGMAMRYNGTTNDMEIFGKNATGDTAAHLRIDRDSGNAVFAGTGGDASVQVPTGAINALEMLGEPGISHNGQANGASPPDGPLLYTAGAGAPTLAQTNVNAPTAGYVLAIGTFTVVNPPLQNSDDAVGYAIDIVTPSAGTQPSIVGNVDFVSCENAGPVYNTYTNVTVQRLFEVQPGVTTVRLRAYDLGNNGRRGERGRLSLIFFPTSYVSGANRIDNP